WRSPLHKARREDHRRFAQRAALPCCVCYHISVSDYRVPSPPPLSKNPPQPAPERRGGRQAADQRGADCAGHTRRAVTKRKTPSGVVARGSATLGGSAVHPVSPEPVQTTSAHARRP